MKFHGSRSEYFLKSKKPRHMQHEQECTIRFFFFMNESLKVSDILYWQREWHEVWASQKIAAISGDKIWNSKWEPREMWPLGWCQVWSLHFLTAPVLSRCALSSVWPRQQQSLGDSSRSQSYEERGADIANMCLLHTLHSDNIEWR